MAKLYTVNCEGPEDVGRCKIKNGIFVDVQSVVRVNIGSDDEPQWGWRGKGPAVPEQLGRALGVLWRAKQAAKAAEQKLAVFLNSDDARHGDLVAPQRLEVDAANEAVKSAQQHVDDLRKALES